MNHELEHLKEWDVSEYFDMCTYMLCIIFVFDIVLFVVIRFVKNRIFHLISIIDNLQYIYIYTVIH